MQTKLNKISLLLIFSLFVISSWALVSEYTFTSTAGTYSEISGGTVLNTAGQTNPVFNAIPLGFTFAYNGVDYTTISVAENAFMAMGNTVATTNLAISSATGTNNVVAALNRDLVAGTNGELSYLLTGTAPSRTFVVQWKNFRRSPTTAANDVFNFQIKLVEGTNQVIFSYGAFTAVTIGTAATVQVGLRGDSNTDFNNRTTTTDWTATTAGAANNANCTINATVYPMNGLTFTYAPVQVGNPPSPAQNPNPANMAMNVPITSNLVWVSGGGAPTGYKVFFGTDNPPTNMVNGTTQTATMYDHPTNLSYSTMYYWQIVPFNADGDAVNCPVWSFTTLADPTVSTYPYEQNFDAVTVPALPVGWTAVNVNADTYTWESIVDASANTAPNAMRVRYNASAAMNDWLLAPPMQLTGTYIYKVKFFYRAGGATYPEKLALYMGSSPAVADLTTMLYENTAITNTTYQMAEINVPIANSGTYYFGFKGFSEEDMFYLYIDSFSVSEITEALDPPTDLSASVSGTTVNLSWTAPGETPPPPEGFNDGFETYEDFAIAFGDWTMVDVDLSTTYGMTGITWPNAYAAQAFMVFNPSATTPATTDAATHSGDKMAACFASTTPPNNDWMMSPSIAIATGDMLTFWAKSYTAQYGLERFKVGISTGGTAPTDFTIISGASYIQAPIDWTEYTYDLSAYVGQNIRFGIQCVSNDAFIFFVDDVHVGAVPVRFDNPVVASSVSGSALRNTGTPVPAAPSYRSVTRDLLGYKVYRDGTLINTITGATTTTYADAALAVGTYAYTVTAIYDGGESIPAGPVSATISNHVAPLNLEATVAGNDVTLSWDSPETPPEGEWITWCNTEAMGNSIGTNAAAVFSVAHKFDATDLLPHQGGSITQMKFVPIYQNCVYTAKVWTGATTPTTEVYSAVVNNFVINEWNLVVLSTPVPIPATGSVWIGYEANTQGGYPAGCDDGPPIEGKGNVMYFQNAWTTLTALAPTLTYNWSIQTFVADGTALKNVTIEGVPANPISIGNASALAMQHKEINREKHTRALIGFKVYRDGVAIATLNDPMADTYTDMDLANGDYVYGVTTMYSDGESTASTVNVNVNVQMAPALINDSFETYPDFATVFAPWTLLDVDQSATYGFSGTEFPGSEAPMSYIIFNPTTTTPPVTGLTAYDGTKMAASFAAVTAPNNDWMITPRINLGTQSALKFYAKSHTATYGLERFRVGVSTMASIIPQGFQYITGTTYVEAPTTWTEYVYDLAAYDGQSVYIGIRCVSDDAFVFYVDKASVHTVGGSVSNDDNTAPVAITELKGNFPNPFNPETNIRFSVKEKAPVSIEIYNVKGQLVKTLLNDTKEAGEHTITWKGTDNNNSPVSSGVYFYKMNAGKYSATKKMIMMK